MASQGSLGYLTGFRDNLEEVSVQLQLEGALPEWLCGTVVRNGPGLFSCGARNFNHWFDGMAKLHKFAIGQGQIHYSCRFIQSRACDSVRQDQRMRMHEFATNAELGVLGHVGAFVAPPLTDNTNVNVIRLGNDWVAMTETAHMLSFSFDSLETRGQFKFSDDLRAQLSTAHPQWDPTTGDLFNLHVEIGPQSRYIISRLTKGSRSRQIVASIPVSQPAYMHSFAQTADHIIIIEPPLLLNPLDLILFQKPYIDCYSWHQGRGTRFIIVSKRTGEYKTIEHEDLFYFHQINSFEVQDKIIIDLPAYPDAAIVNALRLGNLRSEGTVPLNAITRIELSLKSGRAAAQIIANNSLELPVINYSLNACKQYGYAYGAGADSPSSFLNSITKLDMQKGSHQVYAQDGCYYGEPLFVRNPNESNEDDGVLICLQLDGIKQVSELVFLDGRGMQKLASAVLPHVVPFGFHGVFSAERTSQ